MSSLIRVCLIGAGRAGRVHANSLANYAPSACLAAVVDGVAANRDAANRDAAGEDFGIDPPARFASLDEALDWGNFDAVVITTPTFTHKFLAVDAASAGKHIFLSCIVKGTGPKVSAVDGRWAVAGVLAGNCSWLEQRPVYLKEILDAA